MLQHLSDSNSKSNVWYFLCERERRQAGVIIVKLVFCVTDGGAQKARVFLLGRFFLASLTFAGKAREYIRDAPYFGRFM
jgi:hypothetical protein